MNKFLNLLMILFMCATVSNCGNKNKQSGYFYIVGNNVRIMDKPKTDSNFIQYAPPGNFIEIEYYENKSSERWWKIKDKTLSGYIKESGTPEENVVHSEQVKNEQEAIVTVSPLRIYRTSEVFNIYNSDFYTINPGESFTLLFRLNIWRDKESSYYYIKTEKGQTGFIRYTDSYSKGNPELIQEIKKNKIEQVNSWIEIISDNPKLLNIPHEKGRPIADSDNFGCDKIFGEPLKKNDYAPVTEKVTVNTITYYHVGKKNIDQDDSRGKEINSKKCNGSTIGWIAQQNAIEITDLYKYSLKKAASPVDPNLLDFINKSIGGSFNVLSLQIKEVEIDKSSKEMNFYKMTLEQGIHQSRYHIIIVKQNSSFNILHLSKRKYEDYGIGIDDRLVLKDIDNDNKSELIEYIENDDNNLGMNFYSFNNAEFQQIFSFKISGYRCVGWEKDNFRHLVFFKDGYKNGDLKTEFNKTGFMFIYQKFKYNYPPFKKQFDSNSIRVLEFNNGEYSEIDSKNLEIDYNKVYKDSKPEEGCS